MFIFILFKFKVYVRCSSSSAISITIKTCAIFGDSLIYLLFEDTLGIEHNQIIVVAQVFPVELVVLRHLQLEILLREGHESGK